MFHYELLESANKKSLQLVLQAFFVSFGIIIPQGYTFQLPLQNWNLEIHQ